MSAFPRAQQGRSSPARAGSCGSAGVRLSYRRCSKGTNLPWQERTGSSRSRSRRLSFPPAGSWGCSSPRRGRVRASSLRLFLLPCLLPLKLTSWRLVPLKGREGTLSSLLALRKVPVLLAPAGCKVCAVGRWRCKFRLGTRRGSAYGPAHASRPPQTSRCAVLLTYFLCWGSSCGAGWGGCSALRSLGDQEWGANARQLSYVPR